MPQVQLIVQARVRRATIVSYEFQWIILRAPGPGRVAGEGAGREAAGRWLHAPVEHVREIRSELLLKLALLDRAGEDPAALLRAQRAVLEPIVEAIESRRARSAGFDSTLLAWRRATAVAALDFLDTIAPAESRHP